MSYYDEYDEYDEKYTYDESTDNYFYTEYKEPIDLTIGNFSESAVADLLIDAGLIEDRTLYYSGTMERLILLYGASDEVYSAQERSFAEQIKELFVYTPYYKKMKSSEMICRMIAVKVDCHEADIINQCVAIEKIINKAFDGFNMFLFVSSNGLLLGGRIFNPENGHDCVISRPIEEEKRLKEVIDELSFIESVENFKEFYLEYISLLLEGQEDSYDYDSLIIQRRGPQSSYIYEVEQIGHEFGIDVTKEKLRYLNAFSNEERPFATIVKEVEENLSFIKSNRVNTYELLFEAEEYAAAANSLEKENHHVINSVSLNSDTSISKEEEALIDNPEELIKELKRQRGI